MPSNFITPPDIIFDPECIFILNMVDHEVEFLFNYLKTQPQEHNVHMYHSDMQDHHDYAQDLARRVPYLLVSERYKILLSKELNQILEQRSDVFYFGPNTKYRQPVDWFVAKFEHFVI
jgi:hypothetical protein